MHQVWILQVHELTGHDFSGNRFALRVWPNLNLIQKFNVIVILLKCVDVTNPHPLIIISKYVKILHKTNKANSRIFHYRKRKIC